MSRATFATLFLAVCLNALAGAQCDNCPSGQSGPVKVVRVPLTGGTAEVLMCQPVVTSTNNVADFAIDLDAFSGWGSAQDWVLHVYDCNRDGPTPTAVARDIGRITIDGDPSGIASLAVVTSNEWNESSDTALDEGAIDFGGIFISDDQMRFRTRVSVAITGDVTPVSVNSGVDFTVSVGTVTGVKLLRIYDPSFTGLPDNDAGKITISGTLGTNGQLRILVAGRRRHPSGNPPTTPASRPPSAGERSASFPSTSTARPATRR